MIKCFDHKEKKQIALKLVINTQQMHEQGLIEAEILEHLSKLDKDCKEHIVRGNGSFMFRDHVCITFEILGQNLYDYSRSIHFKPIPARQLKCIAKNMLTALMFCHKNGVIHCDMKPENVLFYPNSVMECKIIDFGSSCFNGHQKYEYIQSRFYRAPEVILGVKYGTPMDIWSFACIVVEMLIGRPIFAGEDEQEQLEMKKEYIQKIQTVVMEYVKVVEPGDSVWSEAYFHGDGDEIEAILNTENGYVTQQAKRGYPYGYGEELEFTEPEKEQLGDVECDVYETEYTVDLAEQMNEDAGEEVISEPLTAVVTQKYYVDPGKDELIRVVTDLTDQTAKTEASVFMMSQGLSAEEALEKTSGDQLQELIEITAYDDDLSIEIPDV